MPLHHLLHSQQLTLAEARERATREAESSSSRQADLDEARRQVGATPPVAGSPLPAHCAQTSTHALPALSAMPAPVRHSAAHAVPLIVLQLSSTRMAMQSAQLEAAQCKASAAQAMSDLRSSQDRSESLQVWLPHLARTLRSSLLA